MFHPTVIGVICVCVCYVHSVHAVYNDNVVNFLSLDLRGRDKAASTSNEKYLDRNRRSLSPDSEICKSREETFLSELRSGKRIESKYVFANISHSHLAMAWTSEKDEGTLIVVTTGVRRQMFATSSIWRSTDYGRHWTSIDERIDNTVIRKKNGMQRNPHDAAMVYLLSYHEYMYVTEDGGETFQKRTVVNDGNNVSGSLIFHPDKRSQMVMVISDDKKLFATKNNFKDSREIADNVVQAKWGTSELNESDAIYALKFVEETSDEERSIINMRTYSLVKYTDMDSHTPTTLQTNVNDFGMQGTFLYAFVYKDIPATQITDKLMVVSTDGGKTWNEAQLPSPIGRQFVSILDMSEELIFLHVDYPGDKDTGSGIVYTSAKAGVVYSTSLEHHLYPRYVKVTDFYKVESMRGVYLTSQMSADNTIHTMITFDRGGVWQSIMLPQVYCKDIPKPCHLQINNYYSIYRGVKARPPISTENAPGLVLAHGHAADNLQTTSPDVYITTDGGYNWRKTLEGPHFYQIADSGGLLVAVPTTDSQAKHIKFSTDEGECWHDYQFTNDSIFITGLLTESGGKFMTVSIWGYTADEKRKLVVHVINFADVITHECGDDDYTRWMPHSELRKHENKGVEGCLLGVRETFKKLKPGSWCRNGYGHDIDRIADSCVCTREDYECDYGYYRPTYNRPASPDECIKDPKFSGEKIHVCLRGHETGIITEGYRKIPGDKCRDGVEFQGRKIDLSVKCASGIKEPTSTTLPSKSSTMRPDVEATHGVTDPTSTTLPSKSSTMRPDVEATHGVTDPTSTTLPSKSSTMRPDVEATHGVTDSSSTKMPEKTMRPGVKATDDATDVKNLKLNWVAENWYVIMVPGLGLMLLVIWIAA